MREVLLDHEKDLVFLPKNSSLFEDYSGTIASLMRIYVITV